ncbi:MAG: lipoate--protein ligase family protein, partial [Pseudanabaenales cyanobacterium]|nr:lipoate--protein ligase family protein [Pseudanabaenales cyanobacterium]
MAVDCWLLDQHRRGLQSSVLRFYTWSPPAISLGYHQRHWPDHWRQLTWQGRAIDIVRRPTGGRAVLHQGDLTYAIITSKLAGDRTEAYKTLCQFLIEGWGSLGVRLF